MSEDGLITVFNTCNSNEIALKIAEDLVSQRLASCVNIVPCVQSVYRWREKLHSEKEWLLIIKTHKTQFDKLQQLIKEQHNYELPEILAVPIEIGEKTYLNWIKSATLATDI